MNKTKLVSIAAIIAVIAIGIMGQEQNVMATSSNHYQIGYNDGCNNVIVPGHHTSEYLNGYADGSRECRGVGHLGFPINQDNSHQDNSQTQGQASSINPACRLLCAGFNSQSQAAAR